MLAAHNNGSRYAVGFYRVSTAEQCNSGLGLEAQQTSVRTVAVAQGWTLVAEYSDIASGKDDRRSGFQAALGRCRQLGRHLYRRGSPYPLRSHAAAAAGRALRNRAADMPVANDPQVWT
jgi:hypothetical protein